MDFTGTIAKAMPPASGVSKSTGNTWAKQEYVLDITPPHTGGMPFPRQERVVFTVFGQEKIAEFRLRETETVTVSVEFSAREYNGRWYNDVRALRVQRKAEQEPAQAVREAGPMPIDVRNTPSQVSQAQADLFGGLKDDSHVGDLPF